VHGDLLHNCILQYYNRVDSMRISDHRPVVAVFDANVVEVVCLIGRYQVLENRTATCIIHSNFLSKFGHLLGTNEQLAVCKWPH
jgi:hypothetical protein